MKENEIRELLQRHQISFMEHSTVFGTIHADAGAYQNGFGTMMYTMKEHVLHFHHDGIAVVAVDDMKGTLQEDTLMMISNADIVSIHLRMKLFTFHLDIKTVKGDIHYRLHKRILASPWHKENLSYLILKTTPVLK